MEAKKRVRNWMKINTRFLPANKPISFRQVTSCDANLLAALMAASYAGTIDDEGEALVDYLDEIKGTFAGKYGPFLDCASFVIVESDRAVSASVVTFWKEKPLLAFSMTDPNTQRKGYAGFLIERSIHALAEQGYPELYLLVTAGNTQAESLYRKLGFSQLNDAGRA
jgi:ribosomal protein S18 acetylase RimI-like enzyme